MEKHEFVFDAVLNEEVSNDEVSVLQLIVLESINWLRKNHEYSNISTQVLSMPYFSSWDLGVQGDGGAHCTHNISTNKGNLLCLWTNR